MKTLNIDIETYSENEISNGVYKYVDTPNFEVLIFAYAVDGGETVELDLTKTSLPEDIIDALTDPSIKKIAYNASFERVCLSKHLYGDEDKYLPPEHWECTKVWADELGLPGSLKRCAEYLGLEEQKDAAGTQLINYFSKPCKPTKANGQRTRNLPEHDTEKWDKFVAYCGQDVRTEMAIGDFLKPYKLPDREWEHYYLDQHVHDRGVKIDLDLANRAVEIDNEMRAEGLEKMKTLTGLENPNSVAQLKEWLEGKGHPMETLGKKIVQEMIESGEVTGDVKEVLETRLSLSNSSTKKYVMMQDATRSDGKMHGLLQFYGANRTGRWAGRLLQVQNLPRNYIASLDDARELVKRGERDSLEMVYEDVQDILKQLIRTGIVAKDGHRFIISDFSAIEARVIAWYAGEKWVIDAFNEHGKIYEATAAQMFDLGTVTEYDWKSTEGKAMRQRGKVATLALGYQGGKGSLVSMGALEMGIPEEELQDLVDVWRTTNSNIVKLWKETERFVKKALSSGQVVRGHQGLKFFKKEDFLFIQLPSGRKLSYCKPRLEPGKYGQKITYEGQGSKVYFVREDTYGGKLVENIVQATARDVLAEAMLRLNAAGFPIVFHVHDEVIAECKHDEHSLDEMNDILSQTPDWADGLPLAAEGFETEYYQKD
ncbi:DNA polymerase [Aerococcus urinaeequi]|uniref:DNA polymerase n=1 Tax=Aerococcus urinaeequi TaxID=51665 RepID=UPI00228065B0|nr:DNA polymerase [Aerococcus urinaeequi]MCY7730784.1 DNA polymerase [Aerococcus urinaeequi]